MMNIRGVKRPWLGPALGFGEEKVCLCKCHERGSSIRHFMGCCKKPQTEVGRKLLQAFNDEEAYRDLIGEESK